MGTLAGSVQSAAGRWPRAYVALLYAKYRHHPYRHRIVGPSTEIVIEGFPRSGTSFANRAFASAQPREVRIATHAHHAAHVRRAASLGTPTLVVVRDPARCIPSHFALREELRRSDPSQPPLDIATSLMRYAEFHRDILKVQDAILVVRFEDVIGDYGQVIARVNRRFATDFVPFDHTEANVASLFRTERPHLSPSEARAADNERGVAAYDEASARLRARAESAYHRACAVADAHVGDTA